MVGSLCADFDLVIGCYDEPYCCNKCNGLNEVEASGYLFDPNHSGETSTTCMTCGHTDYWAHGYFDSNQEGLDASDKYFNVAGMGATHVDRDTYERYLQYQIAKGNARTASQYWDETIARAGRPVPDVSEAD